MNSRPHATAELVEELKKGRDEPDASKAATIGVDIIDEYNVDKVWILGIGIDLC